MASDDKLHIVVFPWLAFGHMMPFLELSKSIAKLGHRISFIATPRNIARLPKLPPHLSHLIHFVPLPLPPTDNLPKDAEATSDIPGDAHQYLKKAFDGLEVPFKKFMQDMSPKVDWIVMDFAQWWVPKIGEEMGIPCAFFSVFMAAFLSFYGPRWGDDVADTAEQLLVTPPWVTFPSKIAQHLHELPWIRGAYSKNASGISDCCRFESVLNGCKVLAPRSCREFESDWLILLQQIYGTRNRVLPVGLLAPQKQPDNAVTSNDNGSSVTNILDWLDKQSPRSVVYIAFGSEATLSAELMEELLSGLELSKLPFLWALRKPEGLPEGYEDRIKGRGIIATGWIPQLKVLENAAIGGFLTHCGWSSVIESLQHSIPLVILPIFGDQGINARVMGEKRMGVEVARDDDGGFKRETVAAALRLVIVEDEGEPYRQKAEELRGVFTDAERDDKYVADFVQYLSNNKMGDAKLSV